MRVRGVPLRLLYRGLEHFVKEKQHGYAYVESRSIDFFDGVGMCEVCLNLMDEIDLESRMF